eukprot:Sdes_comp9655_c0_seq1m1151
METNPSQPHPLLLKACKVLLLTLGWYAPSIGLTFYNRWLFREHSLRYPLSITCLHFFLNFLHSFVARRLLTHWEGGQERVTISARVYLSMILPTAVAAGLDIGLTNTSMIFISVTFITMLKSSTVVFMGIFAVVFGIEKFRFRLFFILLMISCGICMAVYSKVEFDLLGVVLCVCASLLSAFRWILTQILMQKKSLKLDHPVDLLYFVSPLMGLSLLPVAASLEGFSLFESALFFGAPSFSVTLTTFFLILFGAWLAFIMIHMEFLLVRETSSVSMSVLGICKEILTIFISVVFFHEHLSRFNFLGLLLSIFGLVLYNIFKYFQTLESHSQRKEIELIYIPIEDSQSDSDSDWDFDSSRFLQQIDDKVAVSERT